MFGLQFQQFDLFGLSRRDAVCLGLALGLHALLLLWTASPLKFLDENNKALGETVVQVEFRTDFDSFQRPTQKAGRKSRGFMDRVSSFFKKAPAKRREDQLASARPASNKINVKSNEWKSAKNTLENKSFLKNKNDAFSEIKKNDGMLISKGGNKKALEQEFKVADSRKSPSIKSKEFRIAKSDAPFKLMKAKNEGTLSMTNSVPINVGRQTSNSIKSLENTGSQQAKLNSKSFASANNGSGSGFGSLPSKGKAGSSELISKGSEQPIGGGGFSTSPSLASARNFGGSSQGFGGSSRLGRTHRSSDQALSNATGTGESGVGKGKSPFTIEGALRSRKIQSKEFPNVKNDARVALKFRVDWAGRVLDGIIVMISSGIPSFDREVIDALKKWVFSRLPEDKSNEIQEGIITFVFRGI